MSTPERNLFLQDFIPFQRRLARFGLYNSLTQTVLKLTAPGVPDIYQGNETWDFSLVDPDNRRPVDYGRRGEMLAGLRGLCEVSAAGLSGRVRGLLDTLEDGRAKLYLTWRVLGLRHERPDLFSQGGYLALNAAGTRAEHLCAFAREARDAGLVVVAPRWLARLLGNHDGDEEPPLGRAVWAETWVEAPPEGGSVYENLLTGEAVRTVEREGRAVLAVGEVLASFPVALLLRSPSPPS